MCDVMMGLTFLSGAMQYQQAQEQSAAQAAMYESQAMQDEQNRKIAAKQTEQMADRYAKEQERLTDRQRLLQGQNIAQAGSSGIYGGSALDVLAAGHEAYVDDSMTLLDNQRNDTFSGRVQQYNYDMSAANNRSAANNARRQGRHAGLGTIIGTAAGMYGLKQNYAKTPTQATSTTFGGYDASGFTQRAVNSVGYKGTQSNYRLWNGRMR